jgi:hypothetical protein
MQILSYLLATTNNRDHVFRLQYQTWTRLYKARNSRFEHVCTMNPDNDKPQISQVAKLLKEKLNTGISPTYLN